MADFQEELRALLNRHSRENESNTPDFILAQYLARCLNAFDNAIVNRELWWGMRHTGNNISGRAKQ